jgi:hypothetical protein
MMSLMAVPRGTGKRGVARIGRGVVATLALFAAVPVAGENPGPAWGLPLHGEAAKNFLRTAEVISVRPLESKAVTRPKKVELSDGSLTWYAVFKTVDEFEPVKRFDNGDVELQFTDSFEYEIAAYELDSMLGLGIVPPAVRRRINSEVGSLSLWVEGAMTEWERIEINHDKPPDLDSWNRQMHTIRLFLQLIYDTDYTNINNLLVTPDWKIYKIDSSRAFRNHEELRKEASLEKFSRRVLASLRSLDRDELEERLDPWLTKKQIEALWVRRGLILDLAARRVAEQGEEAVLFD